MSSDKKYLPQSMDRSMVGDTMKSNPEITIEELLSIPNVDSTYLFLEAASNNLIEKMEEIMSHHNVNINEHCTIRNHMRGTALTSAALGNSIKAIQWLLEHDADPDSKLYDDANGSDATALWLCAEYGNVQCAKLLLDAGADVNTKKSPTNSSALHIAVKKSHKCMVALLLSYGADPNVFDLARAKASSPIVAAVRLGLSDVVAQLINAGAVLDNIVDHLKESILDLEVARKSKLQGRTYTAEQDVADKKELEILKKHADIERVVTDLEQTRKNQDHEPTYFTVKKEIETLRKLVNTSAVDKLRKNATYQKAVKAERKGDYKKAFQLLQQIPASLAKVHLDFDLNRNFDYIYGVKGSDVRVSMWHQIPKEKNADEPVPLQFSAWCQVGRKVYKHGGVDLGGLEMELRNPLLDELWELDIDTKQWRKLRTVGQTPGARRGHNIFAVKNTLYVWGGEASSVVGVIDAKLYSLDLGPDGKGVNNVYTWKVIKTKGSLKPPPRTEFGAVYYKGKYYVMGGLTMNGMTDELWCLNMSNLKWKFLKSGIKRHNHRMFSGRGKLFVLGGMTGDDSSTDRFDSYDIEQGNWSAVPITGDKPNNITEYCAIPVYGKDLNNRDEPMNIMVFGGYSPAGGEYCEYRDFYKNRLLRYDFDTNAWTELKATTDVLPKADCWAAHIESNSHHEIKILIGGGYGFTQDSEEMGIEDDRFKTIIEQGIMPWANEHMNPEASTTMYEVTFSETSKECAIKDDFDGSNWAWRFYEQNSSRSIIKPEFSGLSPTLHHVIDLTEKDFIDPPCNIVEPNNEEELLGVRVQLQGLVGRKDLNGSIGRCGRWLREKERYQVFLPTYEKGGPCTLAIKASNLVIAKPVEKDFGLDLDSSSSNKFPSVILPFIIPREKKCKNYLDHLFDKVTRGKYMLARDVYRGPVSPEAQVTLRTAADSFAGTLRSLLVNSKLHKKSPPVLEDFYTKSRERDTEKAKAFESGLLASTVNSSNNNESMEWLKLSVSLDGVSPAVTRELIVRADVSLNNLHRILCSCIGWTENYHCYAFRRIHYSGEPEEDNNMLAMSNGEIKEILQKRHDECWIGPKHSTAIDVVYQPLYIGGAVTDDRGITMEHLLGTDLETMSVQYVYDFGDWWSHTINVSKYDGSVPAGTTIAHLISGSGACPPEDCGGVMNYMQIVGQLSGKLVKDGKLLSPANPEWWESIDGEFRSKKNKHGVTRPFDFNIEESRLKLSTALRSKVAKSSEASKQFKMDDRRTGLPSEVASVKKTLTDPTKFCAVCNVTVGVKVCTGCNSIAFCCREHQLDFWPRHKADCKRIQKKNQSKSSRKSSSKGRK